MFGIGGTELIIILLFVFLVVGPEKLPEVAKTLGKGLAKFQEAQKEVNEVVKKETDAIKKGMKEGANASKAGSSSTASSASKANAASAAKKPAAAETPAAAKPAAAAEPAPGAAAAAEAKPEAPADAGKKVEQLSFSERKARYQKERAAKQKEAAEKGGN